MPQSIWSHLFAWENLSSWTFMAWAEAILLSAVLGMIGIGVAVPNGNLWFAGAQVCSGIAALVFLIKVIEIAVVMQHSFWERAIFTFVLFGAVGVVTVEAIRGINKLKPPTTLQGIQKPPEAPPSEPLKSSEKPTPTSKISKSKTDLLNKEESPFAVSVEWTMFSYGGKGYGTGFWVVSSSQNSCVISPIQAVFFLRVKNLRSIPVTVIGYSLDVQGVPLTRAYMGSIARVQPKGSIGARFPNGYPIGNSINFGEGPGFSMVHFPNDDGDFTQALLLQMDLIENLLKTPLQPNIPIRGWAFYQSPNENAFTVAGPGHITLETDDSRTFSYDFNLRNPHPELDILDRVMTAKSVIDLSNCKRP